MIIQNVTAPDNGAVPTETKMVEALALQTALAASKLRLYKSGLITLSPLTTLALLNAAECDFDGYTAGGVTIATFGEPALDADTNTVLLIAPSKQFNWVHVTDDVANDVGGAYLVDADGNLRGAVEFDDPVTMNDAADSLVVLFSRRL